MPYISSFIELTGRLTSLKINETVALGTSMHDRKRQNTSTPYLRKFKVYVWTVIAALRIKSKICDKFKEKSLGNLSGISLKMLKAIKTRFKVHNAK